MTDWRDLLSSFDTVSLHKRENGDFGNETLETARRILRPDQQVFEDGILFTDTSVLAEKFDVDQEEVVAVIEDYITSSARFGHKWILLDMSSESNRHYIDHDRSWRAYQRCLYDICKKNLWETSVATNLMIEGGDDVIAVPKKVYHIMTDRFQAEVDLWYCFPPGVDVVDEMTHYVDVCDEFNPEALYENLVSCARFNVSRIPLPDGIIDDEFTLGNSLESYFTKALDSYSDPSVRNVCLASAGEFKIASYIVSEGLPLCCRDGRFSARKVYLAPPVNVDRKLSHNLPDEYLRDLSAADCLFFNCHGDGVEVGDGIEDDTESRYFSHQGDGPTLFDTHLPNPEYRNKLFLSCACFGARYLRYDKERSILLKTLYDSSTINFAGSSIVAKGGLNGAALSENFLRVFLDFIVRGYRVGEAFMRAKLAYLSYFLPVEMVIADMGLTINEFNLFGDPFCRYTAMGNWQLFSSSDNLLGVKMKKGPYPVESEIHSIVDAVYTATRDSVDSALNDIAELLGRRIESDYSLRGVKHVGTETKTVNGRIDGYKFMYSYKCGRVGFIEAHTDTKGNTQRLIISK